MCDSESKLRCGTVPNQEALPTCRWVDRLLRVSFLTFHASATLQSREGGRKIPVSLFPLKISTAS